MNMLRNALVAFLVFLAAPVLAAAPAIPPGAAPNLFASPAATLNLNQGEPRSANQVGTSITSGSTLTILNISPGVPGYVDHIWMTGLAANNMKDGILKVYVDGESTPSITTDMNGLGGAFMTVTNTINAMKHLGVQFSTAASAPSWTFTYPIPYKSSVTITFTNIDTGTLTYYSDIHYVNGVNVPYKLWSSGVTILNRSLAVSIANQQNGSVVFLNVPSGPGWVVYSQITWANATNYSFLENGPSYYLDGTTGCAGQSTWPNAQYQVSGGEDYFQGAYYFQPAAPYWQPWMMLEKGSVSGFGDVVSASLDLLELHGGIKFNNGVKVCLELPAGKSTGTQTTLADLAWLFLYYTPN